ncbi:MAG: hypothetical protein HOK35_19270 [Cytophagia bacterium]|jgi:hypothetical protein|nr:hypothetical protein [Cytophagia bacterium]
MKKLSAKHNAFVIPFLIIVFSAFLFSFSVPSSKKKVKKVKIEIKNGGLKINKNEFISPWSHNRFIHAIGKEDRVDPGVNDICTYDKLGIILYKSPSSDEVSDFNIYMGNDPSEDYSFIPKGRFRGLLIIDGLKFSSNTSLEEVKKKLPDYNFTKSVIGAWRGEYNNLYVYIQYDETDKNIYWFSFGIKD